MTRAVVLLGEVEDNPLVLGFDELQNRLRGALQEQNLRWTDSLRSPLLVPGDFPEFEAVFTDLTPVYFVVRALAEGLHPLAVRVGAVMGPPERTPGGGPWTAGGASPPGPTSDRAGELLYRARKEGRMLLIDSGRPRVDELANALFLQLTHALEGWTERQAQVVALYRHLGRQQAVAEALGVSQQSVSSSLSSAGWKALAGTEAALGRALSDS